MGSTGKFLALISSSVAQDIRDLRRLRTILESDVLQRHVAELVIKLSTVYLPLNLGRNNKFVNYKDFSPPYIIQTEAIGEIGGCHVDCSRIPESDVQHPNGAQCDD